MDTALQELLHGDDLSHWPGPFPSCAARVFGRDAARLLPGARDLTRLRPAWRPADRAARPAGKLVATVSNRHGEQLVAPVSKRARDLAAGHAPSWFGFGDRH
jgi:hypothetical protein